MRLALFFALPAILFAKDSSDYSAHATAGNVTLAADYLVRAIFVEGGVLVSRGYLVVDVAVYSKLGPVNISPAYFSLRLNGSKAPILAQPAFIVANSFDYHRPDTGEPGATLSAGVGNAGVTIGQPGQRTNTPPDPNTRNVPPARRVPETPNPYATSNAPPAFTNRELVERAALPLGDVEPPVSGAVFFAYQGKPESLKSVELLYDGPAGKVVLKLR